MPHIDASEAIKALRIKHPVKFTEKDLPDSVGAMVNNNDPREVFVDFDQLHDDVSDPDAMKQIAKTAQVTGYDPRVWTDPQGVIAHELIHVRQMQDLGAVDDHTTDHANEVYRDKNIDAFFAEKPYNDLEDDAYRHELELAPLVHIEP